MRALIHGTQSRHSSDIIGGYGGSLRKRQEKMGLYLSRHPTRYPVRLIQSAHGKADRRWDPRTRDEHDRTEHSAEYRTTSLIPRFTTSRSHWHMAADTRHPGVGLVEHVTYSSPGINKIGIYGEVYQDPLFSSLDRCCQDSPEGTAQDVRVGFRSTADPQAGGRTWIWTKTSVLLTPGLLVLG